MQPGTEVLSEGGATQEAVESSNGGNGVVEVGRRRGPQRSRISGKRKGECWPGGGTGKQGGHLPPCVGPEGVEI